jgi:organic radical activating enzyme
MVTGLLSVQEANPSCSWNQTLIDALHKYEFEIAIETNGTLAVPTGVDWICVSPKARTELIVQSGRTADAHGSLWFE